jgi:hypothetical protein
VFLLGIFRRVPHLYLSTADHWTTGAMPVWTSSHWLEIRLDDMQPSIRKPTDFIVVVEICLECSATNITVVLLLHVAGYIDLRAHNRLSPETTVTEYNRGERYMYVPYSSRVSYNGAT